MIVTSTEMFKPGETGRTTKGKNSQNAVKLKKQKYSGQEEEETPMYTVKSIVGATNTHTHTNTHTTVLANMHLCILICGMYYRDILTLVRLNQDISTLVPLSFGWD